MTAITTAGLLAGLFGSAFVPTASALRGGGDGNSVEPYYDEQDYSTWWMNSLESSGYAIDNEVSGNSYANDNILTYAPQFLEDNSDDLVSSFAMASWNDAGDDDFSIGFYFEDEDGDAITSKMDLTAVSSGFVEVAWAVKETKVFDGVTVPALSADGLSNKTKSCDNYYSNSDIQKSYSYLDAEAFGLTDSVTDVRSLANKSENGGDDDGHGAHIGAGEYYLCLRAADEAKPGAGTIKITANGVVLTTISFKLIGDLKTITLSPTYGITSIAEGNYGSGNFFTVVGKDSAGQVINAKGNYLTDYVDDTFDEALNEDQGGDTMDVVPNTENFGQLLDLNANVCDAETSKGAGDGDEGHSYEFNVKLENNAGKAIRSNTLVLNCTGPVSDAVVTGFSAATVIGAADWAASAAGKATGAIDFYATVKDASGRPMGTNGYDDSFGFSYSVDDNGWDGAPNDLNLLTEDVLKDFDGHVMPANGKVKIGEITPDMSVVAKYAYDITLDDADYNTTGDQKLTGTLYYTVEGVLDADFTLTRVRNAKKTIATWTADYGVICSNARITFDWENKSGTRSGTVTRRANLDGVATFRLARRNTTIFVYASGCDAYSVSTDPVKARFR